MIVDKAVKKRITPLKKAIIKKRELEKQARALRKQERKQYREDITLQKAAQKAAHIIITEEVAKENESDDGFETIQDEIDDEEEFATSNTAAAGKAVSAQNSIPYKPIFDNLEAIFEDISNEICGKQQPQKFTKGISEQEKNIKKGKPIEPNSVNVNQPDEGKSKKKKNLGPRLREYVDLSLDNET